MNIELEMAERVVIAKEYKHKARLSQTNKQHTDDETDGHSLFIDQLFTVVLLYINYDSY